MDPPPNLGAVVAAQIGEFQQRQREIIVRGQETRDIGQGISQRDNEVNILRNLNAQQGLLLDAATRFDTYRRSQIDRHQRELFELNRVDVPQEIERLMHGLEELAANGGAVRGRVDAVAQYAIG
jgi:hypothetical protein